jgi:hypothetical protein
MKNLYHKVAVASVCTALGFAVGANEEAYSATLTWEPTILFGVNGNSINRGASFSSDGLDKRVSRQYNFVSKTLYSQEASLAEFYIGSFFLDPNTLISSAVFQTNIFSFKDEFFGRININPGSLGIFGYVGNGTAETSDFSASGLLLSSVDISSSSPGDTLNFDVTPFVNQRVRNRDAFAGFGIRALNNGGLTLGGGNYPGSPPRLVIETAEPVPEPTTIFGSAIAVGVGGWLKRKKSSQQNKTTSQG